MPAGSMLPNDILRRLYAQSRNQEKVMLRRALPELRRLEELPPPQTLRYMQGTGPHQKAWNTLERDVKASLGAAGTEAARWRYGSMLLLVQRAKRAYAKSLGNRNVNHGVKMYIMLARDDAFMDAWNNLTHAQLPRDGDEVIDTLVQLWRKRIRDNPPVGAARNHALKQIKAGRRRHFGDTATRRAEARTRRVEARANRRVLTNKFAFTGLTPTRIKILAHVYKTTLEAARMVYAKDHSTPWNAFKAKYRLVQGEAPYMWSGGDGRADVHVLLDFGEERVSSMRLNFQAANVSVFLRHMGTNAMEHMYPDRQGQVDYAQVRRVVHDALDRAFEEHGMARRKLKY